MRQELTAKIRLGQRGKKRTMTLAYLFRAQCQSEKGFIGVIYTSDKNNPFFFQTKKINLSLKYTICGSYLTILFTMSQFCAF